MAGAFLRTLVFFMSGLLPLAEGGVPARAGEAAFNWEQPVELNIAGKPLGELISQLYAQTRVSLQPSKDLAGQTQEIWKEPLYLQARNMPFRQAVEWTARALGCRYRWQGSNGADGYKILLDSGYGWVNQNGTGMILRNIEMLLDSRHDIAGLDNQLNEMFKIITLFDKNYYVRLEEHGEQVKLVAALPEDLKPLFEEALGALERRGSTVPTRAAEPVGKAERELIEKLWRPVAAAYRQQPLNAIAADLASQGGINIGFDQTPFRGGTLPAISLELGKTPLREALEGLAKAAGLPGIEISLPNGIWLGKRPANWSRMASREIAWRDTVAVKAYYVGDFKENLNGQLLAYQVRTRLAPEAWLDPLVSVTYHPPSGNLLVVAPPALQEEVFATLARYRQEGMPEERPKPPALPGPPAAGTGGRP